MPEDFSSSLAKPLGESPGQSPADSPSESDVRVASALIQLAGHGQRLSHALLAEYDLVAHELAVLEVLGAHDAHLRVKEIHAAVDGVSPSTLTRTLDSLEQKALIVRSLNSSDRRSFQVALSVAGRDRLTAYHTTLTHRFAAAARTLSSGERMFLTELLERILRR